METSIPTQAEYEKRERDMHQKFIDGLNDYTQQEKKETRDKLYTIMSDAGYLEHIADLVASGCYGQGAKMAYDRIIGASKRANKVAMFSNLIGSVEAHTTRANTAKVYKSLSHDQQKTACKILERVMAKYSEEETPKQRRYTMSDIRTMNKDRGYFWFSKNTMKHHGSKIESTPYHVGDCIYFVMSDRNYDNTAREFRACQFFPKTGNIKYAGDKHTNKADVIRWIKET